MPFDKRGTSGEIVTMVTLEVEAVTNFGQQVFAVGDVPDFGKWELANAVPLRTTPETFPKWSAHIALSSGYTVNYKYVVATSNSEKPPEWETTVVNRKLVTKGTHMHVDDGIFNGLRRGLTGSASSLDLMAECDEADDNGDHATNSDVDLNKPMPAVFEERAASGRVYIVSDLLPLKMGRSAEGKWEIEWETGVIPGRFKNRSHTENDGLPPTPAKFPASSYDAGANSMAKSASVALRSDPLHCNTSGTFSVDAMRDLFAKASMSSPTSPKEEPAQAPALLSPVASLPPSTMFKAATQGAAGAGVATSASADAGGAEGAGFAPVPKESTTATNQQSQATQNMIWVGTLPLVVPLEEQDALRKRLMRDFSCVPVFMDPAIQTTTANYCHLVLKPMLHHSNSLARPDAIAMRSHAKYCQAFGSTIAKLESDMTRDDTIFVLGYVLMLLPAVLKRLEVSAAVVFQFTRVFPSSEIFSSFSVREECLRGVLSADAVGFTLFDYARHFLHCCQRLLGAPHASKGGALGVQYEGRHVLTLTQHLGVDVERISEAARHRNTALAASVLRAEIADDKAKKSRSMIVVGYDELDKLSGIAHKLRGFESFMMNGAFYKSKIMLLQYVYPPYTGTADEKYLAEIQEQAQSINGKFPGTVEIRYQRLLLSERAALFRIADVLLDTSIRRGQDFFTMEAVLCSQERRPSIVISEFAGCSRLLGGAVRCNPWCADLVASALDKACGMQMADRIKAHELMYEFVSQSTTQAWCQRLIREVHAARRTFEDEQTSHGAVLAQGVHTLRLRMDVNRLPTHRIQKIYGGAINRLIFLDASDGVLGGLLSLASICTDDKNHVYIMSDHSKKLLTNTFGHIKNLGLAAEDGFIFRRPGSSKWEHLTPPIESTATVANNSMTVSQVMEAVIALMTSYAEKTNGSRIEVQEAAVIWDFGHCDPEFGPMQGKALESHLHDVLEGLPVQIVVGKSSVAVRPAGVNKGVLAKMIIADLQAKANIDFLFCLGDDRSDEDMFAFVTAAASEETPAFTCTVGRKPSFASAYLDDAMEVAAVLKSLELISTRMNRSLSTSNLAGLASPDVASMSSSMGPKNTPTHTPRPPENKFETDLADGAGGVGRVPAGWPVGSESPHRLSLNGRPSAESFIGGD